jgi:hypothetical protein
MRSNSPVTHWVHRQSPLQYFWATSYPGFCLFVYSSIRLFVYSSIRLLVYSSIRLFVYSSIRLFVYSSLASQLTPNVSYPYMHEFDRRSRLTYLHERGRRIGSFRKLCCHPTVILSCCTILRHIMRKPAHLIGCRIAILSEHR